MQALRQQLCRRTWLKGALVWSSLGPSLDAERQPSPKEPDTTATDFSRSFCHYVPRSEKIWVRIQIECRCQVFDRFLGKEDQYLLTVRTQTGLRTEPPSDALDPGYDFWMIFSKRHVFIRRVHTSAYSRNPSRHEVAEFKASGWHLEPCRASRLRSGREVRDALKAWRPLVARTEFASRDGRRGFAIEYPVKWADGNPDDTFRVETGPVILLDPEPLKVGQPLEFDDFRWAYLDYRSFDRARCFVERPTSILSGVTYRPPAHIPRRNPALIEKQVAQIEARLFKGWTPPMPVSPLRRLFETDHYSSVEHRRAATTLYALCRSHPCSA